MRLNSITLKKMGMKRLKLKYVSEDYLEIGRLFSGNKFQIHPPKFINEEQCKEYKKEIDDLNYYKYKRKIVTAYTPNFVDEESVYLSKNLKSNPGHLTATDNLFYFKGNHAIAYDKPFTGQKASKAISLGTSGAYNWYHFSLELMVKFYLARKLPGEYNDYPVIIPEEAIKNPSFKYVLECFRCNNQDLIELKKGQHLFVEDLIVIDSASYMPFNMIKDVWPYSHDFIFHNELILEYIAELKRGVGVKDGTKYRKIYLGRKNSRAHINEHEIESVLNVYGFEKIYLEDYTLVQQAEMISQAEYLVGPSGAAWVSLIFTGYGTKCLSWLPKEYVEFCGYSQLAYLVGADMSFILSNPNEPLRSTVDAYRASYYLSPDSLNNAIVKMLES